MVTLLVNKSPITFKIDTGADVTVIPDTEYDEKRDGRLKHSQMPLIGPDQQSLEVLGHFKAKIKRDKRTVHDTIYVVKGLHTPLMGRPTIQKLSLVMRVSRVALDKTNIEAEYPELFSSLGRMRGNYKIQLCENVTPYSISTPRRVPIPLLPKVQAELERMEELGVISKVDEPTDWCSGMVVVPKPGGGVRICVDLTKLNRFVKRERHLLPSVDHVLAQVGDAKVFSKLDANSGFWQIEHLPQSLQS